MPRTVAPVNTPGGSILSQYRDRLAPRLGDWLVDGVDGRPGYDELLGDVAAPDLSEAGTYLADLANGLGPAGLLARRAEAGRLLEEDGVRYLGSADGDGGAAVRADRRWPLDPLPLVLDGATWDVLEPGVEQRARLLDAVLTDLYGNRDLLRRGLIPPEVVLGHPGFLPAADRVRLPGPRQLFLAATDLARGADGHWHALDDLAQAPSGAGYVMQNRRVTSRVLPGLHRLTRPHRLRVFFDTVRDALVRVAPAGTRSPRVVVLSPGPDSETASDQAFLATLLGYPVVTGGDLTVREGRLYLRALGGREQVDVVLRRVDADWADPLEMRGDSRLGVPGLLEASRLGNVSVVNPFGAGVLENPGLYPYLEEVCRSLLGEDMLLPQATTWWCGDDADRSHVLAELGGLVVRPIDRDRARTRYGWRLTGEEMDDLRRRIQAEPWAWTAQEPLAMSTVPVVTGEGLEPRRCVLRTFAVATDAGYSVMGGGLARASGSWAELAHGRSATAAKDVWVLAPEAAVTLHPAPDDVVLQPTPALAPRAAEHMFALGRYAERAEDTVRLLRAADDLVEDWAGSPGTAGHQAMQAVLVAVGRVTATSEPDLLALTVDADLPGSLAHAVQRTVEAAHAVREQLSGDTWIVLGSLERVLSDVAEGRGPGAARTAGEGPAPLGLVYARVLEGLLALAGLGAESMVRDLAWRFLDAGRRLERALHVLALLRHGVVTVHPPATQDVVLEAVLAVGESIITHRRRHPIGPAARADASPVLELLLLDPGNPRSVAFQLDRLRDDLGGLPLHGSARQAGTAPLLTALDEVQATLASADVAALSRTSEGRRDPLDALLRELHERVSELARDVRLGWFTDSAPLHSLQVGQAVR